MASKYGGMDVSMMSLMWLDFLSARINLAALRMECVHVCKHHLHGFWGSLFEIEISAAAVILIGQHKKYPTLAKRRAMS